MRSKLPNSEISWMTCSQATALRSRRLSASACSLDQRPSASARLSWQAVTGVGRLPSFSVDQASCRADVRIAATLGEELGGRHG